MVALVGVVKDAYKALAPTPVRRLVWMAEEAYLNPVNWLLVAAVFLLERIIPAKQQQQPISSGVWQDFAWFTIDLAFRLTLFPLYLGVLQSLYTRYLGFFTVGAVDLWPMAERVVFSFVIYDFLNYLHHVIRHRVEIFWYFHMIHHSQREMNLFADGRIHMVEYLIAQAIICLPMFVLHVNLPGVFWIPVLTMWYMRVYHANLRTNYATAH